MNQGDYRGDLQRATLYFENQLFLVLTKDSAKIDQAMRPQRFFLLYFLYIKEKKNISRPRSNCISEKCFLYNESRPQASTATW